MNGKSNIVNDEVISIVKLNFISIEIQIDEVISIVKLNFISIEIQIDEVNSFGIGYLIAIYLSVVQRRRSR